MLRLLACMFMFVAGLVVGCQDAPLSTSLTDLVAESNDYAVDPYIDFHEKVAINGLLLQPQVGGHWYTAKPAWWAPMAGGRRASPAFGLGVSRCHSDPSFVLIGEAQVGRIVEQGTQKKFKSSACSADIAAMVAEVCSAIDKIQLLTLRAVALTAKIAAARAVESRPFGEGSAAPTLVLLGADFARAQNQVEALEKERLGVEEELSTALKAYHDSLHKTQGLVVARWTLNRRAEAEVSTAAASVATHSDGQVSGYVVLGGLQVSALYVADDVMMYAKMMKDAFDEKFNHIDITTYLVQAKSVAYTNALDLTSSIAAMVNVSASSIAQGGLSLSELDRVRMRAYIATARSLDNTGSVPAIEWRIVDRPMVEYYQLCAKEQEDVRTKLADPHTARNGSWVRVEIGGTFLYDYEAPKAGRLRDGGLATVVSVSAKAPKVFKAYQEFNDRNENPLKQVGHRFYRFFDAFDSRYKLREPKCAPLCPCRHASAVTSRTG